jgi:hypothetical protein
MSFYSDYTTIVVFQLIVIGVPIVSIVAFTVGYFTGKKR